MAAFTVTVVNREFRTREDVTAADQAAARSEALRGALAIGVQEVCNGTPFFGAEVSIEGEGEKPERFLVSMGTSPLH